MNRFCLIVATYGVSYCVWQMVAIACRAKIYHTSCVIFALSATVLILELAKLAPTHKAPQQ